MCLYSKHFFPRKAKEDIVCYKILEKDSSGMITPYTGIVVSPKQLFGLKSFKAKGNIFPSEVLISNRLCLIEGGYVHTYNGIYSAAANVPDYDYGKMFLYECIIPKGTWYHVGNMGDYASRQIIFKKRIKW